ncbi:MAG: alpha/beta hydrolase [Actinobacteria bacterium]|nr:alpha/beta hydrolase [Actinomycetota bacterium]
MAVPGGEPGLSLAEASGPVETVGYGQDAAQVYDVRLPVAGTPARPTVVLIHGGFWRARYDRAHLAAMAQHLADTGHPTAVLEYRRPGMLGSRYPATLADLRDGVAAVARDPRLPEPRVAVGHSAGGQLAIWAASQPDAAGRLAAVVSLAGCVDLGLAAELDLGDGAVADFLGGSPDELPRAYADADPVRLAPCPVPVVLVHGEADPEVPISVSESYLALAAGGSVSLVRLPGVGHYELIDPTDPAFGSVTEAIDRSVDPVGAAG